MTGPNLRNTSRRKRYLSFITMLALTICLLAGFTQNVKAGTSGGVSEAKQSVVRIYAEYKDGTAATGTGFAIAGNENGAEVFVTNRHVIMDDNGNLARRIYILKGDNAIRISYEYYLYYNSDGDMIGYEVISQDWNADYSRMVSCDVLFCSEIGNPDYAVLQAIEPLSGYQTVGLLSASEMEVGDKVYSIGFPGSSDLATVKNEAKYIGKEGENSVYYYSHEEKNAGSQDALTVTDGIVSRKTTYASENGVEIIQHTAQIRSGNSGGPLVNEDGLVVAINTFGFGEDDYDENNAAIYIDYVMDTLDDLNISYACGKTAKSDSENEESEAENSENSGKDNPEDSGKDNPVKQVNNQMIIIIAITVAVVLILAIALVSLLKKKKLNDSGTNINMNGQGDQIQVQPPRMKRPVLVSLSPQHNMAAVALNQEILVGRTSDCKIIYAANTPGVSKRHCSVSYSQADNCFILVDLNSSYGTWLPNGQQLTPGVKYKLSAGDTFYLGQNQKQNMLKVDLR